MNLRAPLILVSLLSCTTAPLPTHCDDARPGCVYVDVCRSRYEGTHAEPVASVVVEERAGPVFHCRVQVYRDHRLVSVDGRGTIRHMAWDR